MKLASILVVLALIILPLFIRVSHLTSILLSKGIGGVDSLFEPSLKLERFKSQHKILFYVAIFFYGILLILALLWMFSEVIAPKLGLPILIVIWLFLVLSIIYAVEIPWLINRYRKLRANFPHPGTDAPRDVLLDWQTKYYDELNKTFFGRDSLKLFLILMAVAVISMIIVILYVVYFN